MVGIHDIFYILRSKYCTYSTLNKSLFDCDDMSYSIQIVFTKLFTDIQRVIEFSFRAIVLDLKCFKLQRVIKEKRLLPFYVNGQFDTKCQSYFLAVNATALFL